MDRVAETRKLPRISVNKLGEYLVATLARRKRIIHDAKFPSTFMLARYTAAENAIADWVCSGGTDELLLAQAMAQLRNGEPTSTFARSRRDCCVSAIANAAQLRDQLQLPTGRVTYVRTNSATPLSFGELLVSVRPEVLLYSGHGGTGQGTTNQGEGRRLGGIKLYFSKQHPLTRQSADYITTLLWQSLAIRAAKDLITIDLNQIKLVESLPARSLRFPSRTSNASKKSPPPARKSANVGTP